MTFAGQSPRISGSAWIAPSASVIGDVALHDEASVWYGAVVRADCEAITIGEGTNLQDNVSAHADPGFELTVGRGVSVGHNAVLHGCTIGDDTLVGMGAVVLNGAQIGARCLIAAGAVVLEGTTVPDGCLVAGVPAKVRRPLTGDEITKIATNAEGYRALAKEHART